MQEDVLGTAVCPIDFDTAARRHGRHFARYLYAARLAGGKSVLDAACGGGVGSAYLATVARSVVGLDLDEAMLDHARRHFAAANLEFRRHDLHRPVAQTDPFDLVVSFETLEHVRDPRQCLATLAACLRDDGIALISVPNGDKERLRNRPKEYHKTQFSAGDFEQLLRHRFGTIQFFSQVYRRGIGHYARKLTARSTHHARAYRFAPGLSATAKTWLAICRQRR